MKRILSEFIINGDNRNPRLRRIQRAKKQVLNERIFGLAALYRRRHVHQPACTDGYFRTNAP